jgi:hypothetical protein
MKIDINKLREVADLANKNAIEAVKRRRQEEELKKQKFAKEQEVRANNILDSVESICNKAASKGDYTAKIMRLKHDVDHKSFSSSLTVGGLRNAGRIVFDSLEEAGLNPSIQFWHDGVGIESGFDIWVNFGEV